MSVNKIKEKSYKFYNPLSNEEDTVDSGSYYQVMHGLLTHSLVLQTQVNDSNDIILKLTKAINMIDTLKKEGKI